MVSTCAEMSENFKDVVRGCLCFNPDVSIACILRTAIVVTRSWMSSIGFLCMTFVAGLWHVVYVVIDHATILSLLL